MSTVTFTFAGDPKELYKTLEDIKKKIQGTANAANKTQVAPSASGLGALVSGLKGLLPQLAAATVAMAAFKKAADFALSAVKEAADRQTLETTFVPILKSTDAAKERISELAKFAAETPFQLPELAKASIVLESLTHGALSTGDGLRLVGDVASSLNQPIQELATHFGRLYSGLMSGRAVGESLSRMQEIGALSAETRTKIEELQKAGKKGESVWAVAAADFARFSGGMAAQSKTLNGAISNLEDTWDGLKAAFGEAFIPAATEAIQNLSGSLDGLAGFMAVAGEASVKFISIMADIGEAIVKNIPAIEMASLAGLENPLELLNGPKTFKTDYDSTYKIKAEFQGMDSMDQYWKRLKKLQDELDEMQNRSIIVGNKRAAGNELAASEEKYLQRLINSRIRLIAELKNGDYQNIIAINRTNAQIRAREAEETEKAAKAQEELAKQTKKANDEASNAAKKWQSDSEKYAIGKIKNPYERIAAWFKTVGVKSANEWTRAVQACQYVLETNGLNLDDAVRYKKLLEVGEIVRGITDEIKKLNKQAAETLEDTQEEIRILESKLTGTEKQTRELEKQRDIRKEIKNLENNGISSEKAKELATKKINLEYQVQDKEKNDKNKNNGILSDVFKARLDAAEQTMTSVAKMGGGFGSLVPTLKQDGSIAAINSVGDGIAKSNHYLEILARKAESTAVNTVALFS